MSVDRQTIPNTPVARRKRIVELLEQHPIRFQGQLEELLAEDGLEVTQATLSRDLDELGAVKVRDSKGSLVYSVPDANAVGSTETGEAKVSRLAEEMVVKVESSGNLAVVRTPIGAADYFALAIDHANFEEVIGTIAGDDTIVVITRDPHGGAAFAQRIAALAEGIDRMGKRKK